MPSVYPCTLCAQSRTLSHKPHGTVSTNLKTHRAEQVSEHSAAILPIDSHRHPCLWQVPAPSLASMKRTLRPAASACRYSPPGSVRRPHCLGASGQPPDGRTDCGERPRSSQPPGVGRQGVSGGALTSRARTALRWPHGRTWHSAASLSGGRLRASVPLSKAPTEPRPQSPAPRPACAGEGGRSGCHPQAPCHPGQATG